MRTLKQLAEDMARCADAGSSDAEAAHSEADGLLVEALFSAAKPAGLGLDAHRLVDAYRRVPKWYA